MANDVAWSKVIKFTRENYNFLQNSSSSPVSVCAVRFGDTTQQHHNNTANASGGGSYQSVPLPWSPSPCSDDRHAASDCWREQAWGTHRTHEHTTHRTRPQHRRSCLFSQAMKTLFPRRRVCLAKSKGFWVKMEKKFWWRKQKTSASRLHTHHTHTHHTHTHTHTQHTQEEGTRITYKYYHASDSSPHPESWGTGVITAESDLVNLEVVSLNLQTLLLLIHPLYLWHDLVDVAVH